MRIRDVRANGPADAGPFARAPRNAEPPPGPVRAYTVAELDAIGAELTPWP